MNQKKFKRHVERRMAWVVMQLTEFLKKTKSKKGPAIPRVVIETFVCEVTFNYIESSPRLSGDAFFWASV